MRIVRPTTILSLGFFALAATLLNWTGLAPLTLTSISTGQAQEHQGGGKSGGGGHSTSGSGGHDEGDETDSGSHSGGRGGKGGSGVVDKILRGGKEAGRGGESTTEHGLEDQVFRGGQGGASSARGSRPVWAGGAVPETVELGRLNVARSPDQVLARALNEAYTTNLDKDGNGIIDADARIDAVESPMANLALYAEAISGKRVVSGAWTFDQAALFLGKAADKNITIGVDTLRAMGIILELPDIDFSVYSYDRLAAHPAVAGPVFGGNPYVGGGIEAFAQAADDQRAIISFEHDTAH